MFNGFWKLGYLSSVCQAAAVAQHLEPGRKVAGYMR